MRSLFAAIGSVFRFAWKVLDWFRRSLANLLFLVFLGLLLFLLFGNRAGPGERHGALVLNPAGTIVEQLEIDPLRLTPFGAVNPQRSETLLQDMLSAIENAAADDAIKIMVLELNALENASVTKLHLLGEAIAKFRATGKAVHARGRVLTQAQYYLAAQADQVSLDPQGMVLLPGYGVYPRYYEAALERFGVTVNVFRVGQFKSAVEPFLRNDMSEQAAASARNWLDQLWGAWLDDAVQHRQLDRAQLESYVQNFADQIETAKGNAAQLALDAGLVDHLETRDVFEQRMAELVGADDDLGFQQVNFYNFVGDAAAGRDGVTSDEAETLAAGNVGLVMAVGTILDGEQPPGTIGGQTMAALLEQARKDESIKSVVMRVDSPGGSVFASEAIRREVVLLQDAGKPVVVSMATYAASGGYWISMNADEIWAEPTTLTGSIGIFGLLPNFSPALNKLGVTVDGVGTSPYVGALRPDRAVPEPVKRSMQAMIEHGYFDFISKVAAARNLSVEQVDEMAQGRVWTGTDALRLGLVDSLGSLEQAIDSARELAELPDTAAVKEVVSPRGRLARLLNRIGASLPAGLQQLIDAPKTPQEWLQQQVPAWIGSDPKAAYAHCLCEVES